MSAPSITFAIPYYSGIDYLARAIESVLAQRDDHWQAVVCDDSSQAGVEEVVREVGKGRVQYSDNGANLGIARNFNRCVDIAQTDLVTVFHADDELTASYCGTMRAAAERHPDAAALFCDATIIGPQGEPRFSLADAVKSVITPSLRDELVVAGEPGFRALLKANFIFAPTLCFRKSVLGGRRFPLESKFVLDWQLTTQLVLDGKSLVGVPDRCYRYRRHGDNATEKATRSQLRFREESEFYDRMQQIARDRGWPRCVEVARQKRMTKLNVVYRTLRSAARLELADARRGLKMLREL